MSAEWAWEPPEESGLLSDTDSAMQLFRRAADLGYRRAQSRLGALLLQDAQGRVQQDAWEGKRLLRLAFEQDDPDAGFHLGQALLQDGDRDGITKLFSACAKGHPRACFQAAEIYREGHHQFPKDVVESLRYTKWSAHQGDAQALSNLGHLIINGVGAIRDDAKAVRLFKQAAKLGAAEGMLNYGLALLRGNGGVKVNYQEALEWAQKSAALGHSLAHQQLSTFFNAARNPNPPARSAPRTREELQGLSIRELRDMLRAEGIDFSDCVEKQDLVGRAAVRLPGAPEPWDAAPEHTLFMEPPKRTREEIMRQRQKQQHQQQGPVSPGVTSAPAGITTGSVAPAASPALSAGNGDAAASGNFGYGVATPASSVAASQVQRAAAPADFEIVD